MTNKRIGHVRGEHVRFIRGHVGNLKRRERLTASDWHIEDRGYETPCWIWNGAINKRTGYCRVKFNGAVQIAHRAVYQQEVGAIPAGHVIDHLCSQRDCVRADHLEAVTQAENVRRSRAAKLTLEDVTLIRGSSFTNAQLSRFFGVNSATISDIRRGQTWK